MRFDPAAKIMMHEQVDAWVADERGQGRRIGFTCGSFDLIHAGHVQYLARARERCDRLLVAVNSDASVRRYKSALRPVNAEEQRIYVVAGLGPVDAATLMDDDRPLQLLLRWKPDLYIKGGDYGEGSLRSADAVRAYGGEVETIASDFATSSSRMMERIATLALHAEPERHLGEPMRGLVVIDRDGTLIRNVLFLHDPAQVEILPGVIDGLARLQAAGMGLAIATNQQGIGLGYYSAQQFIDVNQRVIRELGAQGIRIARVYFCPHSMAEQCGCRKPAAGMVERAMRDFNLPAERVFLIGDTEADRQAGAAAGCGTALAGPGTGGFGAAADWVLGRIGEGSVRGNKSG
jgi:rfaE bifunctional protein nucleotidyltransferase chain/domain